jgi:hypothetical protein
MGKTTHTTTDRWPEPFDPDPASCTWCYLDEPHSPSQHAMMVAADRGWAARGVLREVAEAISLFERAPGALPATLAIELVRALVSGQTKTREEALATLAQVRGAAARLPAARSRYHPSGPVPFVGECRAADALGQEDDR